MTDITRRTLLAGGALSVALGPRLAFAGAEKTKRLELGKPVPSFKLRTPKKRHVYYLRDFAFEGRHPRKTKHPVLIDFFRTDCEPCLRSMPELVRIHEAYAGKGLKVVLIALHEQKEGRKKLLRYMDEQKLPFLVLEDPTDFVAERYLGKTVSLPATFLVDSSGVLVKSKYDAKATMQAAFGDEIERLLSKEEKKGS